MRTCPHCGTKFIAAGPYKNKTYCSDDCRINAERARRHSRGPVLYCVWCGGEIPRGSHRTKYCGGGCAHAAELDRYRKRMEATEIVSDK